MHSASALDLAQARKPGHFSSVPLRVQATSRHCRPAAVRGSSKFGHACTRAPAVRVQAMQSGWQPQPPQQQPQPQLQQPMQARQPAPLARAPYAPASPVFLELTQVLNKQVVTRTSGRSLGTISGAWLDPARGTLVSFDLDDRKPGSGGGVLSSPARAGNIPLAALRQIGDVVLVHDESGLYEQDLDGRLGFVNPVGLDVRTRTGEFLGKVRDLSFSPDNGMISRITYDEFGLPFLPISFFDCYSVAMQDVLSIGRGDIIVYDDAKYRERKESNGLFAAIPSLFKSLNAPRAGGGQLALPAPSSTSDMYRLGSGSTAAAAAGGSGRYLPADYTYEQWQADLRRWEAETGMTYEQYLRSQPQQQPQQARAALPPASSAAQPQAYNSAAGYANTPYNMPAAAAQQQTGYGMPQQQQYGQPSMQQQQRPAGQLPQQQQQQRYDARQAARPMVQQQYGAPAAAAGQQAGPAWGAQPAAAAAAAAAANPYAAPRYTAPAAAGAQGLGTYGANPAAAAAGQQRMPQQQQQQQPPRPVQQQQQQQPLRSAASPAAAANTSRPAGATAAGRPPVQQQQQPGVPLQQQPLPQQQQQGGRAVDDWLVRDGSSSSSSRPRMAESLAEGVLPMTEANEGSSTQQQQNQPLPQQQMQQQQPQQQEVA